jgi:CheY-like chemotaxis protein
VAQSVLIVDDDPRFRRSLALALKTLGFETTEADGGDEAFELLEERLVDLAIVDLMMPGIHGLDVCRALAKRFPSVMVVLTSAYHLSSYQLQRALPDAIGFLPKPCQPDELASFLEERLGGRARFAAE